MVDLAQKSYVNIGNDQAVDHVRSGAELQQAMKIIESPRLIIAHELYVVDVPKPVTVAPARRGRCKKAKALPMKPARIDSRFRCH